jgi:hypothetical protein
MLKSSVRTGYVPFQINKMMPDNTLQPTACGAAELRSSVTVDFSRKSSLLHLFESRLVVGVERQQAFL